MRPLIALDRVVSVSALIGVRRRTHCNYNSGMRKAADTTLRNLAMLGCIPVYPHSKGTRRILEELRDIDPDYDVSVRSVQRGLERLSSLFPISSELRGRANHWYWSDRHALTQIPSMSAPTAFALRLAADYLKSIMPPAALTLLEPYFQHADRVLGGTALGSWKDKAAIIGPGPMLTPPAIPAEVQDAVYTALMENRQVEVAYRAKARTRSRSMVLNPLGVVLRAGIVYLVATSWHYEDIRQYVLHRMSRPRLLDEPARALAGFDLAAYIREEGQFSYPLNSDKILLRALFDGEAGLHLTESRLAVDHRTTQQGDGRILVEATVSDTADLRWWLLGFGSSVEVLEPASLREQFRGEARRLRQIYG